MIGEDNHWSFLRNIVSINSLHFPIVDLADEHAEESDEEVNYIHQVKLYIQFILSQLNSSYYLSQYYLYITESLILLKDQPSQHIFIQVVSTKISGYSIHNKKIYIDQSLIQILYKQYLFQYKAMFILLSLLFVIAYQIDIYTGKAESTCFFNQSHLYFNFTQALYDPPLNQLQTELYFIENMDFCTPVINIEGKQIFLQKRNKVAMMTPRGNCTFIQKTLNAQSYGVDLLIVYDKANTEVATVQMGGSSDKLILMNSIMISGNDAGKIINLFKTCYVANIKIGKSSQIPAQNRQLSSIKLPEVFFDINDLREMEYLSEFYRDQMYQAFISKMRLKHKLVFTNQNCNQNDCVLEKDCLLTNPISRNNYICYKAPNFQHSGKRIIRQQIRSLATLQVLGSKTWFIYRQLFYHNMCHYDQQIQNCINKTLKELEVKSASLRLIEAKIEQIQHPTFLNKLLQDGTLLKIQAKYEPVYASQIPKLFIDLCQTLSDPPTQCNIFKEGSKQIKVQHNNHSYYDFKYTSNKLLHIEINQTILDSMEDLSIILTTKPNIFNSMSNIDLNVLELINPIPTVMGRFGFVFNISSSNLQFASKPDAFNYEYLLMKKKQLVANKFTLLLNLDKNLIYKLMIRAHPQKNILHTNEELITIIESGKTKNFTVQYKYEDNEKDQQFVLAIQAKIGYYSYENIKFYWYENQTNVPANRPQGYQPITSGNIKQLSQDSSILYMHLQKYQLDKLKEVLNNCQYKLNSKMVPIVSCRFVVSISGAYSVGSFLKMSLLKFDGKTIKPLNSLLQTVISPDSSYVQRIKLDSRALPFRLNDFTIVAKTTYNSSFKHEYRLLRHDSQDFNSLQEWNKQYLSRTQILYHEEWVSKVDYTSSMMMKHPYNAIKQHLKINNITIFLVYKINPSLTSYLLITQKISLTKHHIFENLLTSNSYSNYLACERFISSTPYAMAVDQLATRKIKSNVLLQIPVKNQNIRVFVRTYSSAMANITKNGITITKELKSTNLYKFFRPKYYDNLTHYINGYTDDVRHQHPKYLQLAEYMYIFMREMSSEIKQLYLDNLYYLNLNSLKYITIYQIYVQIIDRSQPLQNQKIYLLGNTLSNQYADPTKNLTNFKTSLTLSNPLASYNNYFQVVSKKMIRILNVESVFPQLTNKIQICTYKQPDYRSQQGELLACYNYSQYSQKYWKDLESSQIYSGLKLIESVGRVKIQIPPQNLASDLPTNQSYHQAYEKYQSNLDFYIKIKFKDFDKMVQVQSNNNTEYKAQIKGNGEDIINQYKNRSKQNDTKGSNQNEQIKPSNSTNQSQKDQKQTKTQEEQHKQTENTINQTAKQQMNKISEDLKMQKNKMNEQKLQISKQISQINKQKQQLIKQKEDFLKQKEEFNKQKLAFIKQKENILKQKGEVSKLKQQALKIKQQALKQKQQIKKEKESIQKEKEKISSAKLQLLKNQQQVLKKLQDVKNKQAQLIIQKEAINKQKQNIQKTKEQNLKERAEIAKRKNEQTKNGSKYNQQIIEDKSKQNKSLNNKQSQTITVDNPESNESEEIQINETIDTQFLYYIIGALMALVFILFSIIIFTVRGLHKSLKKKLEGPAQPSVGEDLSENKMSKTQTF